MITDKNKHSFCPLKWQEVIFNPHQNYIYSCCNTTEVTHIDKPEILEKQRQNLLDGIRDKSCEYCWKVEDQGQLSLRHKMLDQWDGTLNPVRIELNLGNICDLQCIYCSPKFSSKWNTDIKQNGPYKIIYDKSALSFLSEKIVSKTEIDQFLNENRPSKVLSLSGGEPLINPVCLEIIKSLTVTNINIQLLTNLSYTSVPMLREIIKVVSKQNNILVVRPSIDSIDSVNSFLRFGFNQDNFLSNLDILLTEDVIIEFLTLVTSYNIWGFLKLQEFIHLLNLIYGDRIKWAFEYCLSPLTHTFAILTNTQNRQAQEIMAMALQRAKLYEEELFIASIIGALKDASYNQMLRLDAINFMKQFSTRTGATIPDQIKILMEIE